MRKLSVPIVPVAGVVLCLALAPRYGVASEPVNNNYPWSTDSFHNDMSVFQSRVTQSEWIGFEAISPSGDVDYHLMSCVGIEPSRKVHIYDIVVGFTNSLGDIDIAVYNLRGDLLAISNGTLDSETVNISALNLTEVVLEVYGWAGATNNYRVLIDCAQD